jgi:polar amino acid transport system substrate-binding protein
MSRIATLFLFLCIASSGNAETLRVLALSSQPFFYDDNGSPAGIEYEILSYFAKTEDLEIEVEYVDGFAKLLERIAQGEADIAAGTITITAERVQKMDFSAPYFPVQVVLVERSGETSRVLDDLKGFKVAAFEKTTAEEALLAIGGVEVVTRQGVPGMLDAVAAGEIRAAAGDSSAIIPVIDDYPGLEISLTFGEQQQFGFALPKSSPYTLALSEHILDLKESGIFFRLVTEHMGAQASSLIRASRAQ